MTHPPNDRTSLDKAVFTVSIDFELIWGTIDRQYRDKFRPLCKIERREVIDRLLQLLAEYRISATWAVVGRLFQDRFSAGYSGIDIPESDEALFHAPELIERIRRCPVPQEIGSHTLTHMDLGHAYCTEAIAARELGEAVRVAKAAGLELTTLIFPRNHIGHLGVAKRLGFTCYRGEEPQWYQKGNRAIRRAGHLASIAAAMTPPTVLPEFEAGIWNIPGSMLYTPSFGPRRYVPVWLRVLRARRGLDAAVRQKRVFHLWFHPTDLVCRMDAMFDGLRRIFVRVAELRDAGQLDVRPMCELVPQFVSELAASGVSQ